MSSFLKPGIFALFISLTPFLSGCLKISVIHHDVHALDEERSQLEQQIAENDRAIAYYKKAIPHSMKIMGGTDPMIDELVTHLEKLDKAIVEAKEKMAREHTNLEILRKETSRQQTFKIGE